MKERPILFSGPMVRAILDGRKTQTRRVVKRIPCQCSEWEPQEMCATTPEGWQTTGHSGRWWCRCCTSNEDIVSCPYGKTGDRLWVRELFWIDDKPVDVFRNGMPHRRAFFDDGWCRHPNGTGGQSHRMTAALAKIGGQKRVPSIHMPRWASRIDLGVTGVRVERLQDISAADALAEGCPHHRTTGFSPADAIQWYRDLWNSLHLKPQAIKKAGKVVGYECFPWSEDDFYQAYPKARREGCRGLPLIITANPWVWVIEFKRVEGRVS